MIDKHDSLRELYEKKYLDKSPQAQNCLVAPQVSGSKILRLLKFEKEWDIYLGFEDKQVTDIWWGLSSLAFELSPSVKQIIVVDPIFHYDDFKEHIEKQKQSAENRLHNKNPQQQTAERLTEILKVETEVCEGIEKRQQNMTAPDPKILLNDSLAQHIEWIAPDSQDVVFLNFVLDKLQSNSILENEILSVIDNAYRITKPWGKIYGVHDRGLDDKNSDNIANALDRKYLRKGHHKDRYMIFTIDKG
jgi:hypothetical protein